MLLCLCMVLPFATVGVSAVPYTPSGNAYKDFGQEHIYFYRTNGKTPVIDGAVTDADGYGEPVATYGFRYKTTVDRVLMDENNEPLPEYKICEDGTFYVYPDENTSDEVWMTITSYETQSAYAYVSPVYDEYAYYSAARTFYFYNPLLHELQRVVGLTKETFQNYPAQDNKGNFYLTDVVLLEHETVDWETNFTDYYTKVDEYLYKPVTGSEAPTWEPDTYYYGEKIICKRMYELQDDKDRAIADFKDLRNHHVVLPEVVNVYARYDDEYFYEAVEVIEQRHEKSQYFMNIKFGSNMSNSLAALNGAGSIYYYIQREANLVGEAKQSGEGRTNTRTYANIYSNLKASSFPYVIAKYGKEGITNPVNIYSVQTAGEDYQISHRDYVKPQSQPDDPEWIDPADDPMQSCKYGTTVYEFRQKWSIINAQYNGVGNPIPEMFTMHVNVSLENSLGYNTHVLNLVVPHETKWLPGSMRKPTEGNYNANDYVFRYPSSAGQTEKGVYRFFWACTSSSYSHWLDIHTTDYFEISDQKSFNTNQIQPIWFPAGNEVSDEYAVPGFYGAQMRADSSEVQKMKILLSLPESDPENPSSKQVAELGAIVAPTEVARRTQLRLGMSSISYIAEEYPVLYGVVDGEWVNLAEDYARHFDFSLTPNAADSYMTWDLVGGKPSGIYTVYTLKADLESPYKNSARTGDSYSTLYDVTFGGHQGEGLYHDFDDFFTFYTIRPYAKYTDGTVVYGEHEYRSLYYIACWMMQGILDSYNTARGFDDSTKFYNMDQMELSQWSDSEGNKIKDADGNPIYIPRPYHVNDEHSLYTGGAEYSIYQPERRAEVFRWYAVRLLSQSNNNTPLRNDDYDNFPEENKILVQNYMKMLENIWDVIVTAEQTVYYRVD